MSIKILNKLAKFKRKMRNHSENYVPFWFRCHNRIIFDDNYEKKHNALIKFEGYCENDKVQRKIRFIEEVEAIVVSFNFEPSENFILCHMDDLYDHIRSSETPPEYYFCWDCGLITWNFPGDLHGSIYI